MVFLCKSFQGCEEMARVRTMSPYVENCTWQTIWRIEISIIQSQKNKWKKLKDNGNNNNNDKDNDGAPQHNEFVMWINHNEN